jgi:uncharacterized membrane protein
MNPNERIIVTLYLKENDPASEQVKEWAGEINSQGDYKIVEIYPEKTADGGKFQESFPYVLVGPYQLRTPFKRENLEIAMRASVDRQKQLLESRNEDFIRRKERGKNFSQADRSTLWITRHYMFLINTLLFLYVALPFLAPVFMKIGWEPAAKAIYLVYKPLCHQFAFRSWFLFGEQPAYPLTLAPVSYPIKYETLLNGAPLDPLQARNFLGDAVVGYKVALCERDVALWGSLLITGVVFSLTGRKLKRIPLRYWLLLGVIPILLDGGSQFMNSIFTFLPARESTPLLRTITGILFGTLTGMVVFPLIEESMNETRQILYRKKAAVEAAESEP